MKASSGAAAALPTPPWRPLQGWTLPSAPRRPAATQQADEEAGGRAIDSPSRSRGSGTGAAPGGGCMRRRLVPMFLLDSAAGQVSGRGGASSQVRWGGACLGRDPGLLPPPSWHSGRRGVEWVSCRPAPPPKQRPSRLGLFPNSRPRDRLSWGAAAALWLGHLGLRSPGWGSGGGGGGSPPAVELRRGSYFFPSFEGLLKTKATIAAPKIYQFVFIYKHL